MTRGEIRFSIGSTDRTELVGIAVAGSLTYRFETSDSGMRNIFIEDTSTMEKMPSTMQEKFTRLG